MAAKKKDSKKMKIEELVEGDKIFIDGQWRTFYLSAPSLVKKGHVNIMVSDTSRRFHRVKENEKIEKRVEA